jgi:hypothetical protein
MKSALRPAPHRSLAGQYFGGLGAVRRTPELARADGVRPRDDQCSLLSDDQLRTYAPGGVFDPLFAGLLADAAGIRAATLGRFGSSYARLSKPAAPTAW